MKRIFACATLVALAVAAAAQTRPQIARQFAADNYYTACVNIQVIDRRGTQPLGPMFARITAMADIRQLAPVVVVLHQQGAYVLFHPDGPAAVPPPADHARLQALFALLGDPPRAANTEALAATQLSIALARLPGRSNLQATTWQQLKRQAPTFDWQTYFRAAGLAPRARLTISGPAYFHALDALLRTTPLPIWKSYLRWRWIEATAELLPAPFARLAGRALPASRPAYCRAARAQFTPQEFRAAQIRSDDYFGDTLRLRAQRRVRPPRRRQR